MKHRLVKWLLRFTLLGILALAALFGLIWHCNAVAEEAGAGILYDQAEKVPARDVGLVFGCAKTFGGQANRFFTHRIEAAAALWKAGKVRVTTHGKMEEFKPLISLIKTDFLNVHSDFSD